MGLVNERVVVCGGGGFIGYLVKALLKNGVNVVRAVDVRPLDQWYQKSKDVENLSLDLRDKDNCYKATDGIQLVFQLAADMGGMGFIENNKALCMLSVLTNTHMLMAAKDSGVERFFFSSSACVYNGDKQKTPCTCSPHSSR
jgi:nucleoside-diphosphate-sugar epimerase